MVKLLCLEDIQDLDIIGIQEVIAKSKSPKFYDKYLDAEKRIKEQGKAPSLSAYLLYQHQFCDKPMGVLAKELNVTEPTIKSLMHKMNIPTRTSNETIMKPAPDQKEFEQYLQMATVTEVAELYGVDTATVRRWRDEYGLKGRTRKEVAEIVGKKTKGRKTSPITKTRISQGMIASALGKQSEADNPEEDSEKNMRIYLEYERWMRIGPAGSTLKGAELDCVIYVGAYFDVQFSQDMLVRVCRRRPSEISTAVKNLESRGFLTREPNPADRRSNFVRLTEEGLKRYKGRNIWIYENAKQNPINNPPILGDFDW